MSVKGTFVATPKRGGHVDACVTCSVASALMTSPSADSDLLMACASFIVSPAAPDFFTLLDTDQVS